MGLRRKLQKPCLALPPVGMWERVPCTSRWLSGTRRASCELSAGSTLPRIGHRVTCAGALRCHPAVSPSEYLFISHRDREDPSRSAGINCRPETRRLRGSKQANLSFLGTERRKKEEKKSERCKRISVTRPSGRVSGGVRGGTRHDTSTHTHTHSLKLTHIYHLAYFKIINTST